MPMPLWWGHINKRIFNPRELRKGVRPVLTHIGRSSAKTYETPLEVAPVDGGYLFILVYGSKSDWVQNAFAAGTAGLRIAGEDHTLVNPRLVDDAEARRLVGESIKFPPGFLNVNEFLVMDLAEEAA